MIDFQLFRRFILCNSLALCTAQLLQRIIIAGVVLSLWAMPDDIAAKTRQFKATNTKSLHSVRSSSVMELSLSPDEIRDLLEFHNKARKEVGVAEVVWSNELAQYAQAWAQHLATTGCKMQHRPTSGEWEQKFGENIFMGTVGFFGVLDAAKSWYSEKKFYRGGKISSSNWSKAGHYTQMVWRGTTKIGCAKVECKGNVIIVCNYDPPGNVLGEKPF